jgi:hypothetical protein
MKLNNAFHVDLPVADTWALLTDLPRVAPCLPGAHLDEVVDGEYRGGLSSRIGPITAKYQGSAHFLEQDEVAYRAVIAARGREERGSGSATATVTVSLAPDGSGTTVTVATDLAISGRAAQFGRSLLAEVSTSLIGEFVRRLEAMIHGGGATPSNGATAPAAAVNGVTTHAPSVNGAGAPPSSAAPLQDNTLDVAGTVFLPLLRRAVAPAAAALIGIALGALLGRRRGGRRSRPDIGYLLDPESVSFMVLRQRSGVPVTPDR